MPSDPTVFIVDDDAAVRDSLLWLIQSVDLSVETFPNALDFLDRCKSGCFGCLVLDVRMPGMSGLDLQQRLGEHDIHLPVIVITGHADVPMAIRAMKAGAFDFIEKPFNDQHMLDCIHEAIQADLGNRKLTAQREDIQARLAGLTEREQEVLQRVLAGKANKTIAKDLDLSVKTVEVHRGRVMAKMNATNLSDLIRMVVAAKSVETNLL